MADQNVVIAQDTVTVTGGESTINVDVNFGAKGDNGSIILYGLGKPQNLDLTDFPRTPEILDWYINIDSTDDEYQYIYQYVYVNNVGAWKRVFKIIPNTYQTNQIVEFDETGQGIATITVSNTTLPLIPQYALPSAGSVVIPVNSEIEMLALPVTPGTYAFRKDLAKYYYLREAPASNAANWEGLIAINAHVDIENDAPIISSFQIASPDIQQDPVTGTVSYSVDISLIAYELAGPAPTPITGNKTTHISINVI